MFLHSCKTTKAKLTQLKTNGTQNKQQHINPTTPTTVQPVISRLVRVMMALVEILRD
jgi:hypothetical protein